MENLTEKLVQAVMNAIETADMDTYINSTRQDRIKAAIRSVLEKAVGDEAIEKEAESRKRDLYAGSFATGAKWMRDQITNPTHHMKDWKETIRE